MAISTIHSHFHFKPCRVSEIVKVVQLTQDQYRHFCAYLLEDMPFITANRDLMGGGSDGVTRCLLVTTRNIRGGLLIDSQGYDYARYAADLLDKSALDLRDVPVEHHDLKLRQPRSGPER